MKPLDIRKIRLLRASLSVLSIILFSFSIINTLRRIYFFTFFELIFGFTGITLLYLSYNEKYLKKVVIAFLASLYLFTIIIFTNPTSDFTAYIWSTIVIGNTIYFIESKYSYKLVLTYISFTYLSLNYINKPKPVGTISFMNISIFIFIYTILAYYNEYTYQESRKKLITEIEQRKKIEKELQNKIKEINELSSFLSICSSCKKIRIDENRWQQIEEYISENSNVKFSHSICPDCIAKLYPEFSEKENNIQNIFKKTDINKN